MSGPAVPPKEQPSGTGPGFGSKRWQLALGLAATVVLGLQSGYIVHQRWKLRTEVSLIWDSDFSPHDPVEGQEAIALMTLTNHTAAPLLLTRIGSACSCVTVEGREGAPIAPETVIAANESRPLLVKVDTELQSGLTPVVVVAQIETRRGTMFVTAEKQLSVRPGVRVYPDHVFLEALESNSETRFDITIFDGDGGVQCSSIEASSDSGDRVTIEDISTVPNPQHETAYPIQLDTAGTVIPRCKLTARVRAGEEGRTGRDYITILVPGTVPRRFRVPVSWRTKEAQVRILPRHVFVRPSDAGRTAFRTVRLVCKEQIAEPIVRCPHWCHPISVAREKSEWVATLALDVPRATSAVLGTIEFLNAQHDAVLGTCVVMAEGHGEDEAEKSPAPSSGTEVTPCAGSE